ncbi:MAG: 3-dehydroquinate synthase II [Planctomycetaceae bacterium]
MARKKAATKTAKSSKRKKPTSSGDGQAVASPTGSSAKPASGTAKRDRQWWFDARGLKKGGTDVLDAAYQSNCYAILVHPEQLKKIMTAKQKVVYVEDAAQLDGLPTDVAVLTPKENLVAKARDAGHKSGCFVDVKDLEAEFPHCVQVCKRGYDFVLIDIHDATYIPYELLLAETENLPTRILRTVPIEGLQGTVDEVNQALNAFGTMEGGVDVAFQTRSAKDIKSYSSQIDERLKGKLDLVEAEVTEVMHTGLGHRVCIDTTTLMTPEEGMIIGSTGWGGIFVCSETHYLPHMNLREFRINAGGVHSYVWGPDNIAVYLNDLRGGDSVLAVDIHGTTRTITVGRLKIERRPLLMIKSRVRQNGKEAIINTFVQNDWHVRVMGADGKVRNSTLVKPGEKLMAYVDEPGRHTGIKVTESIVEI